MSQADADARQYVRLPSPSDAVLVARWISIVLLFAVCMALVANVVREPTPTNLFVALIVLWWFVSLCSKEGARAV